MSVVAVKVYDNRIEMAADSIIVCGSRQETYYGKHGSKLYRFRNVEFMRKEGKYQIHSKLCTEINKNQKSQKRIGYSV